MKLSLVVINGKPEGKEIPIRLTQFLIGRDADCHLRPASPLISKRHCALLVRDDKAYIRDFGSTNGTILNQEPVQGEVELSHGDHLKIGPLAFQVKITQDAPLKAPDKTDSSRDTVADETGSTMIGEKVPAGSGDNTVPMPAMRSSRSSGADAHDEDLVAEILFDGAVPPGGGGPGDVPMGTTVMAMMGEESPKEVEVKEEGVAERARPSTTTKQKIPDNKATSDAAKEILERYLRRPRA